MHNVQEIQRKRKKYGKLPLKDVLQDAIPLEILQIDSIGLYTITCSRCKQMHLSYKKND